MSQPTIQLELPPELMERAEQIARDSNRPLETVLVESLELLFGTASDISLDVLDSYSDVQLWAIVHRQVVWHHDSRLRDLIARGKAQALSEHEQDEVEHLVGKVDRYILLRSKALLLLKQRGHSVDRYLQMSA